MFKFLMKEMITLLLEIKESKYCVKALIASELLQLRA